MVHCPKCRYSWLNTFHVTLQHGGTLHNIRGTLYKLQIQQTTNPASMVHCKHPLWYNVHSEWYTVHSTADYTPSIVHCTQNSWLHTLHGTLYTVSWLHTLHGTLYTASMVQCTPYMYITYSPWYSTLSILQIQLVTIEFFRFSEFQHLFSRVRLDSNCSRNRALEEIARTYFVWKKLTLQFFFISFLQFSNVSVLIKKMIFNHI